MRRYLYISGFIALVILSAINLVCAQEDTATSDTAVTKTVGEDISWVWGEVKSVDSATAMFTVTYMDYQTDEEKELVLVIDPGTKFENAKDLSEIKVGDTASIDYTTKDGKNIAKNISIEKIETMPEAPVSVDTAKEAASESATVVKEDTKEADSSTETKQ